MAIMPTIMYALFRRYAAATIGRRQDPDSTIPEIKGFDPDTRRDIGLLVESAPADIIDFVKDQCLIERLMVQGEVTIDPIEPVNGKVTPEHVDDAYADLVARMARLEEAWNDNVTITVTRPSALRVEVTFLVTGLKPSLPSSAA